MKRKRILLMGIVAAVVVALLAGYFTTVSAAKPGDEETMLREYSVAKGDITAGMDGSGALNIEGEPHSFGQPVKIAELLVKVGDSVKHGDKLALLDVKALDEKLAELEVERKKAEIALQDAKNNQSMGEVERRDVSDNGDAEYQSRKNQTSSEINSISGNISGLQARAAELETLIASLTAQISGLDAQINALLPDDPKRVELQAQRDALSTEHAGYCAEHDGIAPKLGELNTSLNGANSSLQGMESAHQSQQSAKQKEKSKQNALGDLKMNGYKNAVELAEIALSDAERKIVDMTAVRGEIYIKASKDGIVLEINYSEGMETTTEKPVLLIGAPKEMYARVQVAQADIGAVEEGQIVELTFDAFPEKVFEGTVIKKLPMPIKDSNPVAYHVDVAVSAEGEALLTGMTCAARFIQKQVKDVLMLSNKAIKASENGQAVLMKDADGNIFEQPIKTGFSDGRFTEITEGLQVGDTVYVEG